MVAAMTTSILDVPAGLEDRSLAEAIEALRDLYAHLDAHAAAIAGPLELPCRAGCSQCCRQSVFATPLEALYLLHAVQTALDGDARREVVARARAIVAANRELILAFGHPGCPGAAPLSDDDAVPRPAPADRVEAARALNFDCPLLDGEGRCRVYPARELKARLFAVSALPSRGGEYYACPDLGRHLDGREVRLMDAEKVQALLRLHPLTAGEQVLPYYLWRYADLLG